MIPLHVLTGFLGTGKTTLLSHLLQETRGERIAVLVNEVGELALDHLLLERVDEEVLALPSGCVCCSMRGKMVEAVERVLALRPTRIVLETTGLADPAPILHVLSNDPRLANQVEIAGVIAVVDAARIEGLLDGHAEVRRQLDMSDRIVLTKGDLVPERIAHARACLATEAPGREVREAVQGRIEAGWLLATTTLGRIREPSDAHLWLHHLPLRASLQGDGALDFRTHTLRLDQAARIELVQLWLRLVTQLDGPRLLRIKGLVECSSSADLFVLQSAEHALSPPRKLERRPEGLGGVRMVVIERGMPDKAIAAMRVALREAVEATPAPE